MSENGTIEKTGIVKQLLDNGNVLVEIDNKRCIEAKLSGKIRVRFERLFPGQLVRLEFSPFDPALARVVECI